MQQVILDILASIEKTMEARPREALQNTFDLLDILKEYRQTKPKEAEVFLSLVSQIAESLLAKIPQFSLKVQTIVIYKNQPSIIQIDSTHVTEGYQVEFLSKLHDLENSQKSWQLVIEEYPNPGLYPIFIKESDLTITRMEVEFILPFKTEDLGI
jgi:hypothetical protein